MLASIRFQVWDLNKLGDSCVLEDRVCSECGECDLCDLDPNKQCDNCCQCIDTFEGDFAEIEIEDILVNTEEKSTENSHKGCSKTYKVKTSKLNDNLNSFNNTNSSPE